MGLQLLGAVSRRHGSCLLQYWQKKPLLVQQAIPAFAGMVQSSELFRLAAREYAESKPLARHGSRRTARHDRLNPLMLCSLRHRWYLHGWLPIGARHG